MRLVPAVCRRLCFTVAPPPLGQPAAAHALLVEFSDCVLQLVQTCRNRTGFWYKHSSVVVWPWARTVGLRWTNRARVCLDQPLLTAGAAAALAKTVVKLQLATRVGSAPKSARRGRVLPTIHTFPAAAAVRGDPGPVRQQHTRELCALRVCRGVRAL